MHAFCELKKKCVCGMFCVLGVWYAGIFSGISNIHQQRRSLTQGELSLWDSKQLNSRSGVRSYRLDQKKILEISDIILFDVLQ